MKKKLVVLSGAGISAESGIKTFRDSDGLWENYKIEDVAHYTAWEKNPKLVQDFYNLRRKQIIEASPNKGHKVLVELEQYFDVHIITQNIDDLHERAGSSNVLHLHGNIRYSKSSNPHWNWAGMSSDALYSLEKLYPIEGSELNYPDDKALDGFPLRPHVVWFGESVPELENAIDIVKSADILVIVGTSLQVYPANNLIYHTSSDCKIYHIDPNIDEISSHFPATMIKAPATIGMSVLKKELLK